MFVLWLLGPTSSGKTKIASDLLISLRGEKFPVIHFDGDEIRDLFGDSISFTLKGCRRWPHRLAVRTLAFHAGNTGSNPVGVTSSGLALASPFLFLL